MRLEPGASFPLLPAELGAGFFAFSDDVFDLLREAGTPWITREDVTKWLACEIGEAAAYRMTLARNPKSGLVTHADMVPLVEP